MKRDTFRPGDRVRLLPNPCYRYGGELRVSTTAMGHVGEEMIVDHGGPDIDGDIPIRHPDEEVGVGFRIAPEFLELIEPPSEPFESDEPEEDVVNHPSHYTSYPVEVIELTEHMNFCRGNAVKYISRAGLKSKDTEVQDLRKAAWYIEREIARLEASHG